MMGDFTQANYDNQQDDERFQNRHFVFRGKNGWPKLAQVGTTVHISLYESMADRFVEIDVTIDHVEDMSYESRALQGFTTLDGVTYRVTINLFRRHEYNTNVILIPHS